MNNEKFTEVITNLTDKHIEVLQRLTSLGDDQLDSIITLLTNSSDREQLYRGDKKLNTYISNKLLDLGFAANLEGFGYTFYAIKLLYNEPELKYQLTKALYPKIAKEFNTTWNRVERAIRHSIEVAVLYGDIDVWSEMFRYSVSPNKDKPTSGQFLTTFVNFLKLNL